MRKALIALSAAMALAPALPAMAQDWDRDHVSRGEIARDRDQLLRERRDVVNAQRYGNPRDVARERRDWRQAQSELDHDRQDWRRARQYDYNRPDPRYGHYDPARYYRDGRYYQPRRLTRYDRIYRGYDGRYYCRRSDGTTGLIVGAVGGGVLGNAISQGGSETIGTLLGGTLGAILGQSIDRGNVSCR
jgi:hypothetical protein